jgi:hypothetical protein
MRTFKHWKNTPSSVTVTTDYYLNDTAYDGDLYFIINAALTTNTVPVEDTVHAFGDLTQPLHNAEYDTFNKTNHKAYDDMPITKECITDIHFDTVDAITIATVAEATKKLAYTHTFTIEDACMQASISIGLLKAISK